MLTIVTMYIKSLSLFVERHVGTDLSFSLLNRFIQFFSASTLTFIVPYYLSPVELGYYFTFLSMIGLQVFFDLGLSFVIMQLFSKEKALLTLTPDGTLTGNEAALSRCKIYLSFLLKWYSLSCIFFIIIVPMIGLAFFISDQNLALEKWLAPWLILTAITSANIFLTAILTIYESVGYLGKIANLKSIQLLVNIAVTIVLLNLECGLYVVVSSSFCTCIFYLYWIRKHKLLLTNIFNQKKTDQIRWKKNIFPYQWRIAISWLSGFFIFNAITPYIFNKFGPEMAGKVGFSLSLFSTALIFSSTWIQSSIPKINQLISHNKLELNRYFIKINIASFTTYFLICAFIYLIHLISNYYNLWIHNKMATNKILLLLGIIYLLHLASGNLATYVRSHLIEPFATISLASALFFIIAIHSKPQTVETLLAYFASISLIGFTYIFYFFKKIFYSQENT